MFRRVDCEGGREEREGGREGDKGTCMNYLAARQVAKTDKH